MVFCFGTTTTTKGGEALSWKVEFKMHPGAEGVLHRAGLRVWTQTRMTLEARQLAGGKHSSLPLPPKMIGFDILHKTKKSRRGRRQVYD